MMNKYQSDRGEWILVGLGALVKDYVVVGESGDYAMSRLLEAVEHFTASTIL